MSKDLSNNGALNGLKVVDLSRILAGPFCTQILGDLGADIIKIEKPGAGDDTRAWGPPYLLDDGGRATAESAYYLSTNRNKRSAAIDIATAAGQELLHRLLAKADVLVENFKVGGLKKYGLDFASVHARYPHLIYASITGYGQTGPLAAAPGYDFVAQAVASLMSVTGEPNGAPMKAGVALSDVMTGLYTAVGILAALQARRTTGKGQQIDVALADCTLASLANLAQYYLTSGTVAPRQGNAHATIVPYQTFATADGWLVIAVGNDAQFRRFAAVLGHSEWVDDARFATNAARVQNRTTLLPLIENILRTRDNTHWLNLLTAQDIPVGPVNGIDKVFNQAQTQAREMRVTMPHAARSKPIDLVSSPLKLSGTPVTYRHAPPTLGADTEAVLREWSALPPLK